MDKKIVLAGIIGAAVGDAAGVPVEFKSREMLAKDPVQGMRGFGTHNVPPGYWSDDTSMMLAGLDSLTNGYSPEDIMEKFRRWMKDGEYTPDGRVFDYGLICHRAISRYIKGAKATNCGGYDYYDNGNGSLMWILSACLYMAAKERSGELTTKEAVRKIHECSGLTHAHVISKAACGLYYFCVKEILADKENSLITVLQNGINKGMAYYRENEWYNFEDACAQYVSLEDIYTFAELDENEISSGGYVVDTMEAAFWCLLNTEDYRSCILKAVNLGSDTDTVAAVAGGLAGLFYGYESIPQEWKDVLARRAWIEELCEKAAEKFQ